MRSVASMIEGLGGYINSSKQAIGAGGGWSDTPSNYGLNCATGHIAMALVGADLQESDRLYRYSITNRPDLNRMHTAIDMNSNNLNNVGTLNGNAAALSGDISARNGTFSGAISGNTATTNGDITSNNGWLVTNNSKGWMNSTYGGGWYMSDSSWLRSVNNKGIYTGGQVKGGTVRADGRLYTGEYLQLEGTATAGASCSPDGLVGRDSTGAILSCQSGIWTTTKMNFTTSTYNIGKNTRNLSIGVHAYCSWTYLNGSPFGGFQQIYADQNKVWYVNNYAWGNYESGGTITVTCLNLPGAGI